MSDLPPPIAPEAIAERLRARADLLGLDPRQAEVGYVLNLGGFVCSSFVARDRERAVHVKLARPGDEPWLGLLRWRANRDVLHARHRAPRILGWVELEDLGLAGPVLERVAGVHPPAAPPPAVVGGVLDLLRRLHADAEVASRLLPEDGERRCFEDLDRHALDMLRADLAGLPASPESRPPFVPESLRRWMEREVERVRDLARAEPARDLD